MYTQLIRAKISYQINTVAETNFAQTIQQSIHDLDKMASDVEGSVCYQHRAENSELANDLFKSIHLNNPTAGHDTTEEVEQGFRNLDLTLKGRIRVATIQIQEKCSVGHGNLSTHIVNNLFNIILVLLLIVLFILACYALVNRTSGENIIVGKSIKCKICGPGVKWHTMLGDVYGNICDDDSGTNEVVDHECGPESACFTMNVIQSKSMQEYLVLLKEHLKNVSHPYSRYPLLHSGLVKGCLNGLIWDEKCHFFNTTLFYPNNPYWTSTNTCTCTTDNCN